MSETKAEKMYDKEYHETQESSPDVSAEKKKEEEKKRTAVHTEVKLNDLEKNIDEMLASKHYKKEYEKQLHSMKKELHEKKDDQEFLTKTAEKVEKIRKEGQSDTKEMNENPSLFRRFFYGTVIGGLMNKLGWEGGKEWAEKKMHKGKEEKEGFRSHVANGMLMAGAFLFGKKAFGKISEYFGGNDEEKTPEKKEESVNESPTQGSEMPYIPEVPETDEEPREPVSVQSNDEYSLGAAAGGEDEAPLQSGEQPEIAKAQELEKDMYEEHPSALFVLSRMIALGYVPSGLYKRRLASRMLENPWNMKVGLMKLIPSVRDRLVREKAFLISHGVSHFDYNAELARWEALHHDITTGKITSLDEVKKHYPDMMKPSRLEKLLRSKKSLLNKVDNKAVKKIETLHTKESELKALDENMKNLEKQAQEKYKALDALDKAAEKDPVKEKQLRREVEKITKEYNNTAKQIYAETGIKLANVSDGDIVKYQRQFSTVDKLVKMNGGASKFIDKVNARGGKMMLKVGLAGLMFRAGSEVLQQGIVSMQTALDAADFAASMVPFAGGAYDMGVAWKGKDLNGRTLSVSDRWIRGVTGGVSLILDVGGLVTFGAGNAASAGVKASVKAGTKVLKATETAVTASRSQKAALNVYKGAKLASKGLMFGGLTYGVGINVYDMTVGVKDISRPIVEKIEIKSTSPSEVII